MTLRKPTLILAFGVASLLVTAAQSQAQTLVYGLSNANSLVTFSADGIPGAPILTSTPITIGVTTGQTVVGIDFRPFDAMLYAVARDATGAGFLYTVNPATGAATPITVNQTPSGTVGPFTLSGNVGIDFNPAALAGVNALRVITSDNDNYRLAGFNGTGGNTTVVTNNVDGDLNPGDPNAIATAYSNNSTGVPGGGGGQGTVQYVIDATSNSLVIQNPPNAGTQNLVGALGVNPLDTAAGGLDIVTTTNRAIATLSTDGTNYSLYDINLASGAATVRGNFVGTQVIDVAAPIPEPSSAVLVALSAGLFGFLRRRSVG